MGAIAPQRRISKTRKRQRRSHFRLENPSMMVCPNCGEVKLAHVVCKECGYYDGKQVLEIKSKEAEEAKEEAKPSKEEKKAAKAKKAAEKKAAKTEE